MKKIIVVIFIFSSILFAENNYEIVDSTNAAQIQTIKNELLEEIKVNDKKLNDKLILLQAIILELKEDVNDQQNKLNDLERKVSSNTQQISYLIDKQKADIIKINNRINEYSIDFNELKNDIENKVEILTDNLGTTSKKLSISSVETKKKLGNIDKSIDSKVLYIIIGSLILLLFIFIVFFVLKISIKNKTKSLDEDIIDTRNRLEIETIKLDAKLVEILEKQIQLTELKPKAKDKEIDHSIFIKVANEIQRMRTRIKHMPEDTKGIGALKNALRRLEEGLNDNEYELIDLTGKEYVDGLTTKARFIDSEDIPTGQQIITKTIKLQINYKGVLIQPAEIEVSIGE
jgi:hypothetical protein